MIANYHTHTWRCMHATGTEREYIENAIRGGLRILGFSDHTPMKYPGGYESKAKMRPDQLEDYVDTILKLKKEYRNDIEIHIGLEAEYYPMLFESMLEMIEEYPIEYLLLGQHCLGNEINDVVSIIPTENPEHLIRYCKQTQEALETGYFTYFAHPDLLNFIGDEQIYDQWMRKLCLSAKEMDIPLEINFLGIRDKRNYPNPRFWEIAGEVGSRVVFGADAHQPEVVWNPETISVAENMVRKYHLNLVETIEFKHTDRLNRK